MHLILWVIKLLVTINRTCQREVPDLKCDQHSVDEHFHNNTPSNCQKNIGELRPLRLLDHVSPFFEQRSQVLILGHPAGEPSSIRE